MTQHMESYNKGLAREMAGFSHTLAILMSMLRVCLEYGWSMARVWLEAGKEQLRDCIATPHSQGENATLIAQGDRPRVRAFRYVACLLLLMIVGANSAWGAFTEGLYYIKSNKDNTFYLCPSIGCYYSYNVDQPHLTTFKTGGDQYSIWKIVPVEGETDTYYIIHYKTGRYLKSNEDFTTDNGSKHNRKAVHLEVKPTTLTDDFKFLIKNNSSPYQIYPKVYYTDASDMSFNPTSQHKECYAPEDGGDGVKGIVGLYSKGDDYSKWQIPSVPSVSTPCATPIIKYDGDNINISYPYSDETGITIYYTTDGSDPTTSSSHEESTSFNISASGVVKVRAFAAKSDFVNSDEAVLWGSARPFLIQSKECADYYLVPAANGTNITTSSLPGTSMQWTLQNAGASTGGIQYYYFVNSNSKKINCKLDNTLTLNDESTDANKFCVIENGYGTGYFFLIPVSQPNRVLYKNKGNVDAENCKQELNKKWNTNLDQWNLRVCNAGDNQKSLFSAPPFNVSDSETNYYLISCAGSPSGYYIIPPGASSDYAMASNTSDEYEVAPWMFKTATSDNWLTYYYIINAATGKYLYFDKIINSNSNDGQAEAICMKDFSEKTDDNADRFQFVFVPSTTANAYYIVPKVYAGNFRKNQYYGIWFVNENTQVLQTIWSRGSSANNVKWTFSKFAYCNNPVFTESDGNISISCITTNSEIYITNNGTEPNISDNSQKYSAENTLSASNQHLIKAKAVVYDNQTPVSSRVVTLFNIPDITLEAGPFVYKADYWEPAVTLSIGETTATTGFTPTYNNNKNAGTANVTITNSDLNSTVYVFNGPLTEFTIDPAPLTVTAKPHSIGYGDEPDNNGVNYEGFAGSENEDTEGVFVGTLSYSYNTASDGTGTEYASYDSPIGTYYIIPSGLTSTNYNITFVSGTMTVGTKSIGNGNLAEGFTLDFDENSEVILEYGTHPLTKDVDYTIGSEVIGTKYSTRDFNGIGNYTGYFTLRNANVNFQTDADRVEWSATFVAEPDGENARDNTKGHALPEGITAYIITDIVENWAIPEPLTYIPEGIPVLLISNKETGGFIVTDASGHTPITTTGDNNQKDANMLKEVTTSTHFNTKTIYLLYKNEFVYNMDGDLAKGKVYLDPTTSTSPAPRLRIKWDDMTSITELQNHGTTESQNDSWYTLDGRKLNRKPTQKGIYLVNGNKVIIR